LGKFSIFRLFALPSRFEYFQLHSLAKRFGALRFQQRSRTFLNVVLWISHLFPDTEVVLAHFHGVPRTGNETVLAQVVVHGTAAAGYIGLNVLGSAYAREGRESNSL
jgi:hypothetical protein